MYITTKEFARRRGVTYNAVVEAIRSDRVTAVQRDTTGRVIGIEEDRANDQWDNRTNKHQQNRRLARVQDVAGVDTSDADKDAGDPDRRGDLFADDEGIGEAQTRTAVAKADLLELQLQQKRGELVPVHEVKAQAFDSARSIRDAVLSTIPQIAPQLAALRDVAAVEIVLAKALKRVLHITADETGATSH